MENKKKNLIFLTGFMASGKSTVGPHLAKALGYDFIDLDSLIEKKEGKTVEEIFATDGEKYFRQLESKELSLITNKHHQCVVSLGGGTITRQENRIILKSRGILIYLNANLDDIFHRVQRGEMKRPLLTISPQPSDSLKLRETIEKLFQQREKFYLESDFTVNTSGKNVKETVEEILSKIKGRIE
ncbi:MAG: shikimate kinase [Candidatus Kryptoniota bacterium]